VLIDVWQWTPMVALILLAGLTTLPNEPDEAARIDGAGPWQRFWHITLPLLRPTLVVAVLLRGIDAMETFDVLYATKGRGGGSFHEVETLNVYAYGLSFDYYDYGRSSTVLILFFVIILGAIWALTARHRSTTRSRTPKESTE
jgi:multiple sugar transport system permease protein